VAGLGTNGLGKPRISAGALKAIVVISQIGSRIQIASTIATT
jgi:hypothetical protein